MLFWLFTLCQKGIEKNEYKNIVFNSIGYFFQLIAGFIYNEIIICNFCGLNYHTKKNLLEIQSKELDLLKRG